MKAEVLEKNDLTASELREKFEYSEQTGIFIRKVNHKNGLKAGTEAGCKTIGQRKLYKVIRINRRLYLCHRLAWLYVHGEWPDGFLDHINNDGLDNRIENLRVVTNEQNVQASLKLPKHNKSGYRGVIYDKKSGTWIAGISIKNKRKVIGNFDSPESAHKAYLEFKRMVHFQ